MVTKKMRTGAAGKKGKVKLGNLKLNRETVKDLTGSERRQIKGAALSRLSAVITNCVNCVEKQ